MPNQTPGEIGYAAYRARLTTLLLQPPNLATWPELSPFRQAAWEAAAQAVHGHAARLAAATLTELGVLPCRVFDMTPREYAIYLALIPAVGTLKTLADWYAPRLQDTPHA